MYRIKDTMCAIIELLDFKNLMFINGYVCLILRQAVHLSVGIAMRIKLHVANVIPGPINM